MKKVWLMMVAGCLLLGACAQRMAQEQSVPEQSRTVSESEYKTNLLSEQFPINGLIDKTEAELFESYVHTVYYNEELMTSAMDTPLVLYINNTDSRIPLVYDKRTGVFSSACRDTLCDHETCLWGTGGHFVYCGELGLYFLYKNEKETAIYATDFYGNGAKELYRTASYDLSHLVEENGYLYVLGEGYDEEADESYTQIIRIDTQTHEEQTLLEKQGVYYFMPLDGKILYFNGATHCLFDNETGESVLYADETFLPIATHGGYFYYKQDGMLYRQDREGNEELLDKEPKTVDLRFSRDEIWFVDTEGIVCRADLAFSETKTVYIAETDSRISTIVGDGNLLFYQYSEGTGASRKHYTVFRDLQKGTELKAME